MPEKEISKEIPWNTPFLHRYLGWAHSRSTQQGSFHVQDPLPHWASIINQPLLHFSHLSKRAWVLLSTGPPPIIVGHWGGLVPSQFFCFFVFFFTPFISKWNGNAAQFENKQKWDLQMGKKMKLCWALGSRVYEPFISPSWNSVYSHLFCCCSLIPGF